MDLGFVDGFVGEEASLDQLANPYQPSGRQGQRRSLIGRRSKPRRDRKK
jgi:hypothetical protein